MTGILIPETLFALAALAVLGLSYVMAVRTSVLEPVTVNPFQAPSKPDTSADTLPVGSSLDQTTAPVRNPWQVVTLANLNQVEDLLDSLEAHGVAEREVVVLQNNCFAVRWR